MATFLKALLLVPLALVAVLLAIANRHAVTLSFDPFAKGEAELSLTLPLFVLLLVAVIIGVVIGGTASWLGQARHRRERRYHRREAERFRHEAERLRDRGRLPA